MKEGSPEETAGAVAALTYAMRMLVMAHPSRDALCARLPDMQEDLRVALLNSTLTDAAQQEAVDRLAEVFRPLPRKSPASGS